MAADGDWEEGAGTVTDVDIVDDYVGRLMAGYAGGAYRIGWDAGNGAAGPVIEKLAKLLPGEHHLLFTEVDGNFPNHHPDPTEEKNLADLKALVAEKKPRFRPRLRRRRRPDRRDRRRGPGDLGRPDSVASSPSRCCSELPGATIIADVKASQALFDRIAELGGKPLMWKTGHSLIKTKMKETGAPLAGEMSGPHLLRARLLRLRRRAICRGPADPRGAHDRQVDDRDQAARCRRWSTRPRCASRSTRAASSRWSTKCSTGSRPRAPTSTAPTARASTRPTAGGCCARRTRRTCWSRAPRRRTRPALDRLLAQIDAQLAASGLERGPQAGH